MTILFSINPQFLPVESDTTYYFSNSDWTDFKINEPHLVVICTKINKNNGWYFFEKIASTISCICGASFYRMQIEHLCRSYRVYNVSIKL